jgi:hypothetical protein
MGTFQIYPVTVHERVLGGALISKWKHYAKNKLFTKTGKKNPRILVEWLHIHPVFCCLTG